MKPYKYTVEQLADLAGITAKKHGKKMGIPRNTVRQYDAVPPKCSNDHCTNPKVALDYHWITGRPVYRPICHQCHQLHTAGKHGLKTISQVVAKNAGFDSMTEYLNSLAINEGYTSHMDKLNQQAIAEGWKNLTQKNNSTHPYLRYRKEYCENIDGRLGAGACTTTIIWEGQLDVDHIDGHYKNNDPSNLQTLCKCCHAYKTNLSKDYATIGRTKIKKQTKNGLDTMLDFVLASSTTTQTTQHDC